MRRPTRPFGSLRTLSAPPSAVLLTGEMLLLAACGAREDLTEAAVGSVEITTVSSGVTADDDGYRVTLDGGNPLQIAGSGTVRFSNVPVGERTVALTDVADGCTVADGASRQVGVDPDAVTHVGFDVTCALTTQPTLSVAVGTSGTNIDADGYSIRVDGGSEAIVRTNGQTTFTLPTPGTYGVRLAGVNDNCTVEGENPRAVEVPGQTAFAVTCWPPLTGRIAFVGEREDSFEGDILVRRADGVELDTVVSQPGSYLRNPSWSPDGSQLAFERFSFDDDRACCVFLVNADGTNVRPLVVADAQFVPQYDYNGIYHPKWSPDGQRMLFVYDGGVYTVRTDRSELTRVVSDTMAARVAAWAPDGNRIVFGVRRMRLSGGSLREFDQNLYLVNADGSGLTSLTTDPGTTFYRDPAWSPDGRSIAFTSNRTGGNPFTGDLFVMNPGTGSVVNVTDSLAERTNPAWSPDGSHLTFALTTGLIDFSLWTVNADGSHPLRLTTAEEPSQYAPSWGP